MFLTGPKPRALHTAGRPGLASAGSCRLVQHRQSRPPEPDDRQARRLFGTRRRHRRHYDCGGGERTAYAIGLNWNLNLMIKFMLDSAHGVIDNPQVHGGPDHCGAVVDRIAGRTQIIF
jgi:hypothetical protein